MGYKKGSNEKIKLVRSYDTEEKIKAFKYGKDLIPFSVFDEDSLSLKSEKSFSLLGFVTDENDKFKFLKMSSCDYVVGLFGDERAKAAIAAFSKACLATGKVALVRFCF